MWKLIILIWRNVRGAGKLQSAIDYLAVASFTKFCFHTGEAELEALNIMWQLKLQIQHETKQAVDSMI